MLEKWYNLRMRFLPKRIRVDNAVEYRRLPVTSKEPALREKLPTQAQIDAIREAKEYLFQTTADIRRVDKPSNP